MAQTNIPGTYPPQRTLVVLLVASSLLAFAPDGALALGVGPSGVTAGSDVGTLAPGESGGLDDSGTSSPAVSSHTTSDLHGTSSRTARAPVASKSPSSLSTTSDDDGNLSTTAAPIGANQSGDVGQGVLARMPGAAGR